jgi:hypothetical protein
MGLHFICTDVKGNIKSVENVMPKLFSVIEKEKGCK